MSKPVSETGVSDTPEKKNEFKQGGADIKVIELTKTIQKTCVHNCHIFWTTVTLVLMPGTMANSHPLTNRVGQSIGDQHRSDDRFTRTTALPEGLFGLLAGRFNEYWNGPLARTTALPEGFSGLLAGRLSDDRFARRAHRTGGGKVGLRLHWGAPAGKHHSQNYFWKPTPPILWKRGSP